MRLTSDHEIHCRPREVRPAGTGRSRHRRGRGRRCRPPRWRCRSSGRCRPGPGQVAPGRQRFDPADVGGQGVRLVPVVEGDPDGGGPAAGVPTGNEPRRRARRRAERCSSTPACRRHRVPRAQALPANAARAATRRLTRSIPGPCCMRATMSSRVSWITSGSAFTTKNAS